MDIKHGDIITLDNGDTVKVSLKVLSKKVTELVVERKYRLKTTGSYCHTMSSSGTNESGRIEEIEFQYVGKVIVFAGERYIFYAEDRGSVYSMWSTKNLDFVVKEV